MADGTYQTPNYEKQGGAEWVIGGALNIDGGEFQRSGTDKTDELDAALANAGTVKAGAYAVVAGDDTAGTVDIVTGLSAVTSYVVFILRSGVPIYSDQAVSEASGTITVADGGATYALTADDVINWIAVGTV